jgi:hypothetical protein
VQPVGRVVGEAVTRRFNFSEGGFKSEPVIGPRLARTRWVQSALGAAWRSTDGAGDLRAPLMP